MPKIEQLDWSKLKPTTTEKTVHSPPKSKHKPKGYKKYDTNFKPPKAKKPKKVKSIDKTLWNENFDQMQHLSNIMREY